MGTIHLDTCGVLNKLPTLLRMYAAKVGSGFSWIKVVQPYGFDCLLVLAADSILVIATLPFFYAGWSKTR